MDPDANLEEQLRISSRVQYQLENDKEPSQTDLIRLTELVISLDDWIRNGRLLPTAWRPTYRPQLPQRPKDRGKA